MAARSCDHSSVRGSFNPPPNNSSRTWLGAFLDLPCYGLGLRNWLSKKAVDIGNGTCDICWCCGVCSAFHSRAPLQAERLHNRCRCRLSRSDGVVRGRTASNISQTRSLTLVTAFGPLTSQSWRRSSGSRVSELELASRAAPALCKPQSNSCGEDN